MISNIHMHTHFCDGKREPRAYVLEALERKMISVGFSAHGPVPFESHWALPENKLNQYVDTILELKREFASRIQIYLGLELDYFPDLVEYSKSLLNAAPFDYFIGSVHFVDTYPDGKRWTIDGPNDEFRKGFKKIFNNDSEEVTRRYFKYIRQMVADMKPPVIGHVDKLKMQFRPDNFIPENHPVFREELLATLEVISKAGSIVEVNTRGIYKKRGDGFYPGTWAFPYMREHGVKVMVNSDAHQPHEIVSEFENAYQKLREAGYTHYYALVDGEFISLEIPFS